MKKVSIYCKSGIQSATPYYRFIQFFDKIECDCKYRKMLSDRMYSLVMPISSKNLFVKTLIFLYIIIRVSIQLGKDLMRKPDVVIISRRLVNRILPSFMKLILNRIRKKSLIIWDFDDNIIESGEVSKESFKYFSEISNLILIASPYLRDLIEEKYRIKVKIMETTDGDIFSLLNDDILNRRLTEYNSRIKLLWVGTSSSISFVEQIIPQLEIVAQKLLAVGKTLELNFVCDMPILIQTKKLKIMNYKWSRKCAIENFLSSHIGLMPLANNEFTKGKGGFKLIQYLSASLPVVGSSVGINNLIIDKNVGYKVDSLDSDAWIECLFMLSTNPSLYKQLSLNSFAKFNDKYSYTEHLKFFNSIVM